MEGYKPPQENNIKKRRLGLGEAAALGLAALSGGPVSEEVQAQYSTEVVPLSKAPAQLTEEELREMEELAEVGDLLSEVAAKEVALEETAATNGDEYVNLSDVTRTELAAAEATVAVTKLDIENMVREDRLTRLRESHRRYDPVHEEFKNRRKMEEYEVKKAELLKMQSADTSKDDDESNRIRAALDAARS